MHSFLRQPNKLRGKVICPRPQDKIAESVVGILALRLIAIASSSHRFRKMFSYMTERPWVINLEREIGRGEN